jgi:hypothetical protein
MCCQHIAENIHKKFGVQYKAPFWQIAHAGSDQAFNEAIQALQRDAPQVEEYMSSIGYENFAFTRFPRPRFGHDTSNIVESSHRLIQPGVIYESSPLFSFLMEYINGVLQHGIKDRSYD